MKAKKIITIILLWSFTLSVAQDKKDYFLLQSVSNELFNLDKNKEVKLNKEVIAFNKQELFFTKAFLQNYLEPTIGTNSKKLKKMIKTMDFDFLAKQKREKTGVYNIQKINNFLSEYTAPKNNKEIIKSPNVFFISLPIYTKEETFAFIYYQYYCGIDCGQSGVKIYKFKKGKWVFENNIPLTLS